MKTSRDTVEGFVPLVRNLFGAAIAAVGVVHVIFGEAVTRMFPTWPDALPGRPVWAHIGGVLLAISGVMIVTNKRPRLAAGLIGIVILLSVVALHVPRSLPSGNFGDEWLNVFKWLAMASGAFFVADTFPVATGGRSIFDRLIGVFSRSAPWLLGAFMVGAAVLHFRYAEGVSHLIPEWIPQRVFWVYLTGVTLTAGGVGLVIPQTARLAALFTSLMIFLWFLLVHIQRMLAAPSANVGWCEMGESLAFAAMAFLLAGARHAQARD